MNRDIIAAGIFTLILATSSGCGGRQESTEVPPPPPPPPLESSTISIPIEVPLSLISTAMEQKVPKVLQEKGFEGEPEGVSYVVRRGAIRLSAQGSTLTTTVPISFSADLRPALGGGGEKAPPPGPLRKRLAMRGGAQGGGGILSCEAGVDISFTSQLTIGADWKLQPQTRAGERHWTRRCEMTPLKIDVTRKIDQKVAEKVQEILATVDDRLGNAGAIKDKITHAWEMLQEPRRIADQFWIVMNPESIALKSLEVDGQSLRTQVAIVAQPTLSTKTQAPAVKKKPLPANTGKAGDGLFHVTLEAEIPFTQATEQARSRMAGQEMGTAERKVKVADARVFGKGTQMVVEVRLEAPVAATIALSGRPVYIAQTRELAVENLDFMLESRNALAKGADWLLHSTFQQKIAEKARFNLSEKIDAAKNSFEQALNRPVSPNATLQCRVQQLEPQAVWVTADAFKVRVIANGTMQLRIQSTP